MSSGPPDFVARRLGSVVLGAALLGLAGWIALRNLGLPGQGGWIFWVPIASWLGTLGLLCWWAAIAGREASTRARIAASWRMGWRVGAAGLALGFIGPLLITPKANLGPLLGILITGPVGFVLGALAAAVAWRASAVR